MSVYEWNGNFHFSTNGNFHFSTNGNIFTITYFYFLPLDSFFGLVQFWSYLKNSLVHVCFQIAHETITFTYPLMTTVLQHGIKKSGN